MRRPTTLNPLDPRTRTAGIRALLDEAHAALPPEVLEELVRSVRRSLADSETVRTSAAGLPLRTQRPGLSQAARVFFRPIELLINVAAVLDRPLSAAAIRDLDRHLDEVASRPRGTTARDGAAA